MSASVKKLAKGWKDEFIKCRVITGHHWDDYTAEKVSGGFEQKQHCEQCDGFRWLIMDNKGRITGRRYAMPKDYPAPKGTGNLSSDERGELRLLYFKIAA